MRDITRAITSYAVLLNRPWCLDPARLEDQIPVWARLIEQAGAPIVLADIEQAIGQLLASESPSSVMPGNVIQQAAHLAQRRVRRAGETVSVWRADRQLVTLAAKERYGRTNDQVDLRYFLDGMVDDVRTANLLVDDELLLFIADMNQAFDEITA